MTRPASGRAGRRFHGLLVAVALAGCASYTGISEKTGGHLRNRDYARALAELDHVSKKSDRLLVDLERGLILHYGGSYDSSNVAFESAERRIDESYTKSLSAEALSLLTSDNLRAYDGSDFEEVMVHFYRALNYVELGRRDDALVEARKATGNLSRATSELSDPGYGDDAFLQYFSGLLYDWGREWNDAYVSLRRAEEVYRIDAERGGPPVPRALARDLARVAERMGFVDEAAGWRERYADAFEPSADDAQTGEVVLLVETGFVPQRHEVRLDLPILTTDSKDEKDAWIVAGDAFDRAGRYDRGDTRIAYWLAIAYPTLEDRGPGSAPRLRLPSGDQELERVSDLGFNARQNHADRQRATVVRTTARAVLKYVAKKQADEAGSTLGFLVNAIGALTEHADLRSWRSLPHDIWVARVRLPAGTHDLTLETHTPGGVAGETVTLEGVSVEAGQRTWVSYRLW